ncbi:MAG: SPOR domain-containing protein [Novosphingobium sp.]|nr:SPOR domain-containing protein [Novosphingobium sp.]
MTTIRQLPFRAASRPARLAIGTAMAAILLAGCAGGGGTLARAGGYAKESSASSKSVASAERAVEKSPRDAALRTALGHAYLEAGRFESAADAFADAMVLGDTKPGTALSLSLAQTGEGQFAQATYTLDQWRDDIPAVDLGLAMALAGQPARGIAILEDTIRGGENTAKVRQNLAYAYALAGRWREARLMAMEDVPANMIDQRIGDWAAQVMPQDHRKRVATLLSVPLRPDNGQPDRLALAPSESAARLAVAAPSAAPRWQGEGQGELPAAGQMAAIQSAAYPEPDAPSEARPVMAPEPAAAEPASVVQAPSASFDAAFAQAVQSTQPAFVSQPVIQAIVPRYAEPAAPRRAAPVSGGTDTMARPNWSTHLVQLGSFSSEARARAAWTVFTRRNPQLRNHTMTITPAVVNGRNFWRVAAGGLDARGASGLCASVKQKGGACIAYAAARPLPGARPDNGSPRYARR